MTSQRKQKEQLDKIAAFASNERQQRNKIIVKYKTILAEELEEKKKLEEILEKILEREGDVINEDTKELEDNRLKNKTRFDELWRKCEESGL